MNNQPGLFQIGDIACGRAAILQQNFLALMKIVKKTRPTVSQRRQAGFGKDYDPLFTTVKLNFLERGVLSVEQWIIDEPVDGWRCPALISQITLAGIRLESYTFSVLVNIDTLHDILKLLDTQRLDMEWNKASGRFAMKNGNNRTSLIAVKWEDLRIV